MREKRNIRETLLAAFLMVAVAITMIPAGLAVYSDQASAAAEYSYTVKRPTVEISGHKMHVSTFNVSGLGLVGTCCQAGTSAKNGKATVKKLSNTDIRAKLIYYYGYLKGYLGKTNRNGFLLGRALSWASGNTTTWPATHTEVKNFINAMPSNIVVPDRFECYVCNPTNASQNFIAYKMNQPAYVILYKTSTDARSLAAGSGCSFEGIEYTVYNSSGAAVGVLTCGANGGTNTLTLDTGTYTVRETKTNKWYKLNPQEYTATLGPSQVWSISAADAPETGTVHIKKSVKGRYEGNLAFDFRLTNTANAGISYNVKTDAETGEADVQVIPGTYRCEEILPEDAGLTDVTGPQTGEVKLGETFTFERENKVLSSGMLQVSKSTDDGGSAAGFRFKVTGELYNQGSMTEEKLLEEAKASVTDYDEDSYSLGEWKVSGEDLEGLNKTAEERQTGVRTVRLTNTLSYKGEKGKSISELVDALNGDSAEGTIPKGTIISENGKGYKATKDVAFAIAYEESGEDAEEAEEPVDAEESGEAEDAEDTAEEDDPTDAEETEEPEEADGRTVDREKTAQNIRSLLTGDSFEETGASDIDITAEVKVNVKPVEYVYNKDDPETSGYETDLDRQIKNSSEKTENKGSYKVRCSSFDWYGAATVYQEIRDGKMTGKTEAMVETTADGTAPALEEGITHGSFTVTEVMTEAQKKQYRQPESQTKEIRKQDGAAAFSFSFENKARWTGVGLLKKSADGNVSGITFRIEGTDSRGEKVKLDAVTDSSGRIDFGKLYAGEYVISEQDFDPEQYENSDRLAGYDVPAKKLVITGEETEDITVEFENVPLKSLYITKVDKETRLFLKNAAFSLSEGDKQLAVFRIVLDDYGKAGIDMISCAEDSGIRWGVPQASGFPEGDENSQKNDSGEEYNFAVLKGLKEGSTYTLKEITAPSGYAASVDETFVFEDGKKLILENAAPEISTTAVDQVTGSHLSNAEGMVTIVDTVSYSNLGPGHKYLMSGVLACRPVGDRTVEELSQDADAVEVLKDAEGRDITAQKEFVPKSENGTVDIAFTFDASLLDGKQAVAMEQLVDPGLTGINGVITVVASHEDIEDEGQSIYFPKVGTKACADDTGRRVTEADGEVTITDTVEYSNVIAGKIYEITGTLMDKETGKPILSGGKKVTSSVGFVARKDGPVFAADGAELREEPQEELALVSGTVELKFTFDGSELEGKQAVVFEKLMTGGALIGEHSDLDDEEQTVYMPAISTTASTNGADKVSDKVKYKNLLPGEQYVMRGVLMDKATGGELLVDGKNVTAQMAFVPDKKDGSVNMEFPVDVKKLRGRTAVVFETCSVVIPAAEEAGEGTEGATAEVEIISHKDINNKAQTVAFSVHQTGQTLPFKVLLPSVLMAAAAACAGLRRIRKAGRI